MNMRTQHLMVRSLQARNRPQAGRLALRAMWRSFRARFRSCGSRTAFSAIWLACVAALSFPAAAADLQIYPLRLVLDAATPTAILTIGNRGDSDVLLQLNVMQWRQGPTGDIYEPTRDVLANPGVFLLKGGEQQVARFALRAAPDVQERSYRIVIQEVPRQRVENGLTTVLRLLVPVFVPTPNPSVSLQWAARPTPQGMELTAHNVGNVHVQLKLVKLDGARGGPLSKLANMYVLPAATGVMLIRTPKPPATGETLQLTADSDQGSISASVRVGAAEGESARP
jgi:fimbrial chaperone protein